MTEDHDDFAFEPVPGLPDRLPPGETMLWQGSPNWRGLAVSAFHVRKVAVYFALLLAWQLTSAWGEGAGAAELAGQAALTAALAAAAACILCGLAYLYAHGTIYTLTTRRIVIRSGLALPVTLNLPLALIETASLGRQAGGTGSIALTITRSNRIAWLVLWPNVRPWTMTNPQPLLRNLDDADGVVKILAGALAGTGAALRPMPARGAAALPARQLPTGATLAI